MGVEVVVIAKRLLRRALSVIYMGIGFFMVLAWIWRDYVGVVVIAIAYLIGASILYGYVFKPLFRFRELAILTTGRANMFKYLGFTASLFGLAALLSMIIGKYVEIPSYTTPLLGMIAIVVSISILLIGVYGSPKLLDLPDIIAILLLGSSIIIYLVKPSLVLPVIGSSFMVLGMYTYYLYYLKPLAKESV